jgi:hypothetical protein
MFRDFRDKAVVSALHRLHLLRLFDVICVLDRVSPMESRQFTLAPPSAKRMTSSRSPHHAAPWSRDSAEPSLAI